MTFVKPSSKTMDVDTKLCFLHIPKTGGISLQAFLRDQFPDDVVRYVRPGESNAISVESLSPYRLIFGHWGFAGLARMPFEMYFITMLRDPVERLISLYYFWRSHSYEHMERFWPDENRKLAKQLSFEEFIEHEQLHDSVRNVQAKQVLNNTYARFLCSEDEFLDAAKRRLRQFAAVGVTERFDEFLNLLATTFGWPTPTRSYHGNTHAQLATRFPDDFEPRPKRFEPCVIERIRELNRVDTALHQWAQTELDRHLKGTETTPPAKVISCGAPAGTSTSIDFQSILFTSAPYEYNDTMAQAYEQSFCEPYSSRLRQWQYQHDGAFVLSATQDSEIVAQLGYRLRKLATGVCVQLVEWQVNDESVPKTQKTELFFHCCYHLTDLYARQKNSPLLAYLIPRLEQIEVTQDHPELHQVSFIQYDWYPVASEHTSSTVLNHNNPRHRQRADRFWEAMRQDWTGFTLCARDYEYVFHRYIEHPLAQYSVRLVNVSGDSAPAGIIVTCQLVDALAVFDLIGPQARWPDLVAEARSLAREQQTSTVTMWLTVPVSGFRTNIARISDYTLCFIASNKAAGESSDVNWFASAGDAMFI